MTGFGQGSAEFGGLRLTVDLRSVNNRFTDLRFRMPGDLSDWEPRLRRRVLGKVRRGRVEITVGVTHLDGAEARPVLNRPLVEETLAARKLLADEYGIKGDLDLATALSLSGIFKTESPEIAWGDEEREALERALDEGLEALDADRAREGESLRTEILSRLSTMTGLTREVRARAEQIPSVIREKLLQRLQALGGEVELDPARVAQEATYLADRGDVTEEIVRLEGHLAQASRLLGQPDNEPLGKKLDFLLQEIHRETNTVCSKSSDLELTRGALALKVEAEKVREQVQNLE
jgi:uncharacterized protein (TIGR00255 family)